MELTLKIKKGGRRRSRTDSLGLLAGGRRRCSRLEMPWWKERAKSCLLQSDEPPPSDYRTWQRWRVLGHRASLLLVTVATFYFIFFFFYFSGAIRPTVSSSSAAEKKKKKLCMLTSTRSLSLWKCAVPALKIQHSTTRAVIDSIEIFIVLRKDTLKRGRLRKSTCIVFI